MYDNIIIGAGYGPVGFCLAHGGNNLILSDNLFVDEFSPCFAIGECGYQTVYGEELYRDFKQNDLIRERIVDSIGGAIRLYQIIEKHRIAIRYQSFVSAVKQTAYGFEVSVHNWEGAKKLPCRNVIQTTGQAVAKSFNALVFGQGTYCTRTFHPEQYLLRFPVGLDESYTSARLRLINWLHGQESIRLIMTAYAFEYFYPENKGPFEAFEAGYVRGLELRESVTGTGGPLWS